jgi:hypothetical protein
MLEAAEPAVAAVAGGGCKILHTGKLMYRALFEPHFSLYDLETSFVPDWTSPFDRNSLATP